jgi:DNA adenine methylase
VAVLIYPGGKARLAAWIADLLPPPGTYRTFLDAFGGAANVLLEVMRRNEAAGFRGVLYVYNDADEELVNFFRVLREPDLRRQLREMLRWTPYSRRQFQECLEMLVPADPVRRAWRFFVINRQSYCGAADKAGRTGRWSYKVLPKRADGGPDRWLRSQERLEALGEAFRRIQVECLDFAEVLRRYDAPEVLAYCDPPYLGRGDRRAVYAAGFSPERHRELAGILAGFRGLAAVSGYRCPEHEEWYAGWERHEREVPCCLTRARGPRPRRVEALWLSPAAARARKRALQLALGI